MGLLNTSNYTMGGSLPANAVIIGLYEENPKTGGVYTRSVGADGNAYDDPTRDKFAGLAAQQVRAQVQKAVKPVYEIGSYNYYLIDGRPQGQGEIAYLFGPSGTVVSKIQQFSNVCKPCTLRVKHDGTVCKITGSEKMDFKGGTLTSFSIQATAEDFMVTGSIGFIFMDVQS